MRGCARNTSRGSAAHDVWRTQADIANGEDPLGRGAFGAVLPGELDGMPVAVKWAVGTDASREALLREYSFLRSPSLQECYFIVTASPARTFVDSGPVMASRAKHHLTFENTVAVDNSSRQLKTMQLTRTFTLGLLWDGGQDYMPSGCSDHAQRFVGLGVMSKRGACACRPRPWWRGCPTTV